MRVLTIEWFGESGGVTIQLLEEEMVLPRLPPPLGNCRNDWNAGTQVLEFWAQLTLGNTEGVEASFTGSF